MVCCIMWNVCGLDGLQSVKWCRRAYGVKRWCEIAVWCGMSWCDFKCFVVWIYKVMCSVQSSLLFLYYAAFSVMSVQYYLCASRIKCTQCSVSVYSVSSVRSMQAVFRVASVQFLKHSVYRVESVAYTVSGVQC